MKVKKYNEFIIITENEKIQDQILDKISKNGINSITDREKDMLDRISNGEDVSNIDIESNEYEMNPFTFVIESIEESEIGTILYGAMTIKISGNEKTFFGDIVLKNGIVQYYVFASEIEDEFDTILEDFDLELKFYEFCEYITKNL